MHTEGPLHPWIHLGIFLLLGFLAAQAVPSGRLRLMLLLAIIALGWGTEFLESLRDGWPVERHDGLLDTVGVVLGGILGSAGFTTRQANPR